MSENRPVSSTRIPADSAATARAPWRSLAARVPGSPGLTAFATFTFFTAFAGDFWRNLLTWYGFGVIVAIIVAGAIWLLASKKPLPKIMHLPSALIAFVAWCALSIIWSVYRPESLLGFGIQLVTALVALALAVSLTKPQFLRAFSAAMRWILGLSLAFEVLVAIFFPGGVLPLALLIPGQLERVTGSPGATAETVPAAFLWSQGHIFAGSAIQGILGNRNLLAMAALLCVIAVAVQWYAKQMKRWPAITWIALGLIAILLCKSATVFVGCAVVLLAVALVFIARPLSNAQRWGMYGAVFAVMLVMGWIVLQFNTQLFGLINRSSDMSGRGDIWAEVGRLGSEHWLTGMGWISYWAPWVEPFKGLLVVDGVHFLQAHNAYLDVWMQTGLIGAFFFVGIVLSTLIRTWWLAVDRPQTDASGPRDFPPTAMLAFLLMVALTVQSLTESRLLVEGNWLLLCYLAIYSKLRIQDLPALPRRTISTKTGPLPIIERNKLEGL